MYFGVDDDMELYGLQNAKRLLEDIPNKITTTMGLVVDVDLHEQDGLDYIEVTIVPANVPISYRGKYYYRSGSTLQELTGTALTDFLMRKLNTTWDATTEPSATLDDIDPQAVSYFLNAAIREGRINQSARDESLEQLLRRLHLIGKENGQLTKDVNIQSDQKSGLKTESDQKSDQKSDLEIESDQKSDQKIDQKTGIWPKKWSEKTSQILDAITANNTITIAMLQEQLNLRNTTLKKMLREMQNVGLIRRVGPDKGGHWEVIEQQKSDTVNDTENDTNDTENV